MQKAVSHEQHHIVGGGIAGLATAVYSIRDAEIEGKNIHIYEQLGVAGGSLDGSGDAERGYMIRGGRMFEEHFACTFDLLDGIPSADNPDVSVTDDILALAIVLDAIATKCRLSTVIVTNQARWRTSW